MPRKAQRGDYVQRGMKLHVKSGATDIEGKRGPSLKLTLFLSKDAVRDIFRQMERFLKKHDR